MQTSTRQPKAGYTKLTMRPADVSPTIYNQQIASLRTLTPTQRLEMMGDLYSAMKQVMLAGIHHRHPDFTPEQLQREYARLLLGPELLAKLDRLRQAETDALPSQ